jgi:hypothetical protein
VNETGELPELPQWVTDLIEAAEERGYDKGWDEGRRKLHWDINSQMEQVLKNTDPR